MFSDDCIITWCGDVIVKCDAFSCVFVKGRGCGEGKEKMGLGDVWYGVIKIGRPSQDLTCCCVETGAILINLVTTKIPALALTQSPFCPSLHVRPL